MLLTHDTGLDATPPDQRVERLLRDRAAALAARGHEGGSGATELHLVLTVGGVTVAVPVRVVRHVVPVGHLARVPGSGPAIVGLSAVLGTVVPVADAAVLLQVAASPRTGGARLVLLDDGDDGMLGLLVDAVEDLAAIDRDDVRPDVAPTSIETGLLVGVTSDGRNVLDVDAVRADPQLWPPGSRPAPRGAERT